MRRHGAWNGFTLIELLVVLAIIATLLTLAAPRYFAGLERSKEAALRQNLAALRDAIDKHAGDTGRYPESLALLVERRYLRAVPVDPITQSAESWLVVAPKDPAKSGVFDVRSGAPGNAGDGTPFSEW